MTTFLSSTTPTLITNYNNSSNNNHNKLKQLPQLLPQRNHFLSLNSLSTTPPSRAFFNSPVDNSLSSAAATDDEEYDEDDADDDDGDDVAADEYFEVSDYDEEEEGFREDNEVTDAAYGGENEGEEKWKRVEKLCKEVRAFGAGIIDVDELASLYNFRIDRFQRSAIQAFLRGSSVVVSAPTSSGKTLIAEAAAVATVARGKRLFYTTPLKALSNQKFREFRETFGESHVGLLTGDSSVNKDAPVLIMTTEILRNMLYQSVGNASSGSRLSHVNAIVLDEVHYLSDISRGTVWEEIIIYCPEEVQLICLSATVANPDELAGWIDQIHGKTELVTSSERPVPLIWHFSTKYSLLPLLDEKGVRMNRKLSLNYLQLQASGSKHYDDDQYKMRNSRRRNNDNNRNSNSNTSNSGLSKHDINTIRRSQVPQIIDTLYQIEEMDMLPAIWFIFSRRGCDAAVQYLEGCQLLDDCEMSEVELALKRFRVKYPDAVREMAVKGLLRGVAAHHAGCLPLWKSFVEELFQRGLVKVVFATETLAAGINMPARTAVIASLTKRTDIGRGLIRSNELLQMAGRAGRRGIDRRGHVVLIQSPYEGAEECCKLLFAGIEPLMSQFTASYGMVLNLLAGARIRHTLNDTDTNRTFQVGRTLEEAKKLIEQSFGNYVSSNVMLAAKEELDKIEKDIKTLTSETSDDAIDRKARKLLSEKEYKEIADLQEELRAEKRLRTELRRKMEAERVSALKPLLKESIIDCFPFLCLQYTDTEGSQHLVSAVYLGELKSVDESGIKNANVESEFKFNNPDLHVALGSDNSWYLFSEKWIKTVYKIGFPKVASSQGNALPWETNQKKFDMREMQWEKLADSEFGGLWIMEGSLETWSWSLNVPVPSSLSESDELLQMSDAYHNSVECYKKQRTKVARLKKMIARTEGFKEYKKIIDSTILTEEKIRRLEARSSRLINRIQQIEPSGWKEFLQISKVIHESRALDIDTHLLFPLGETAAAIRGENELWLAMVIRNKALLELKPAELAGVCASLVSEGIKLRPSKTNSYIYEPSSTVVNVVDALEAQRNSLLQLQEKYSINISCYLDSQFSGMVEAWASGLSWRELMMDCAMDEGDLARLLRRTIDLLAQIPKLPDVDPALQRNAMEAAEVMDRPPISELAG